MTSILLAVPITFAVTCTQVKTPTIMSLFLPLSLIRGPNQMIFFWQRLKVLYGSNYKTHEFCIEIVHFNFYSNKTFKQNWLLVVRGIDRPFHCFVWRCTIMEGLRCITMMMLHSNTLSALNFDDGLIKLNRLQKYKAKPKTKTITQIHPSNSKRIPTPTLRIQFLSQWTTSMKTSRRRSNLPNLCSWLPNLVSARLSMAITSRPSEAGNT